jgi:uncharacterized protein
MILSRYHKIFPCPEDADHVLLFSAKTLSVIQVPKDVLRDIEQGRLSEEEADILRSQGFLAQSAQDEHREMLRFLDEVNAASRTFNAIVVLNLDCNLGCTYCFEGTRKGKHYLSYETADAFVEFLRSGVLEGKERVSIVFYGGEPLLSMDSIVRIAGQAGACAADRKLVFDFSLVTNGTLLTPRAVEKLKPLGLRAASVTLDGPREVHNAFRPFKTGKGSFDVIVDNIRDVAPLTDIQIGGNYTRQNYREFPRLLDYLVEQGLGPERISSVKFDPVVNESSEFAPPDFHDGCLSTNEPWLFEAGIFLRAEILRRGFRTHKLMPSVCIVERPDSIVVNYDGDLYKCPGLIGRKEFRAGTVSGGMIDHSVSHDIGNWKNEECLACAYLPLCFGGCKYVKLLDSGRLNGVNCRKQYFDNTLAALVSQDVRYNL